VEVGNERGGGHTVGAPVPVKANSGVRARVPAAGKVLEGDDQPTLLREDVHYLHYITMAYVTDRLRAVVARSRHGRHICYWLPVEGQPIHSDTFIFLATGRSTAATVTDVTDDVTTCNCFDVPMTRASDNVQLRTVLHYTTV